MARVLLSYYSDYGEAMYDAITSELLKNGNDVCRFNIKSDGVSITGWGGVSKVESEDIINAIRAFDPSVVLNFNNSLPLNIYQYLSDGVKNCLIDADNPGTFWNKKYLRENSGKYVYLGLQSYSKCMYEKFLGYSLTEGEDYLYFPPATVVKSVNLKKDKNISFIGSNFYPMEIPYDEKFYSRGALNLYDKFKNNYFQTLDNWKTICKDFDLPPAVFEQVGAYYVGQERLKYMQAVADLGFTFYGIRSWKRIAYYDFELAKCFDPSPKLSIDENQWVYNTSRISINISHPQAKTSFSWRVMDIMASGACLLMEDKPDWRNLFEKFLSKETLNSVLFTNRLDMREKAIRLLSDEDLRVRCVKDLNNAIDQNGRWVHRFAKLEEFLSVNLLNLERDEPLYKVILSPKKVKSDVMVQTDGHQNNFKFKNGVKVGYYSLAIFVSHFPGIRLLFTNKSRDRYLKGLHKYL